MRANDLPLSKCLITYYTEHAQYLKRADTERGNLSKWLEFFQDTYVHKIRSAEQRDFIRHLVKQNYAKSTIEGIFKTGIASIKFAWQEGMLADNIAVINIQKELKNTKPAKSKGRPLEISEMVRLFEVAESPRIIRFLMILIGTACRPTAAIELTGAQFDLKANTINLLPANTVQNNKYRPTVKLPSFLRLLYHPDNICTQRPLATERMTRPMHTIRTQWNTLKKQSGLEGDVVPYSVRHTIARWLRMCAVDPWHVSAQLGHGRQGSQITEIYAPSDPNYLSDAVEAIEGYFSLIYSQSPKLQQMPELKNYEPRCGLVAKYKELIS